MPRPSRSDASLDSAPTLAMPDRPLVPTGELPIIAIRAAGNHPFVYRKMVIGPVGPLRPSDGDLVRVVDRDQLPVGFGLWNARSQISLRLLKTGCRAAWARRSGSSGSTGPLRSGAQMLRLDEVTTAYRVVHAEGDGLSGLIIDRYDDVLSVETFSLGIYQRIGSILPLVAERLGTKHAGSPSTSGSPWPRISRAVRWRVPGSPPG